MAKRMAALWQRAVGKMLLAGAPWRRCWQEHHQEDAAGKTAVAKHHREETDGRRGTAMHHLEETAGRTAAAKLLLVGPSMKSGRA